MANIVEILKEAQQEVWNNGRVDLIVKYYTEDYVAHTPEGDLMGINNVRDRVLLFHKGFPDWHEKLLDCFTSGNKLVFRHLNTGTHLDTIFGIPATGKKVSVTEIGIVYFKNGKIAEHWAMFDYYGMLVQLGAKISL